MSISFLPNCPNVSNKGRSPKKSSSLGLKPKLPRSKSSEMDWGRPQLQPKQSRADIQIAWANLQLSNKWSTDSSTNRHRGQALTRITLRRWWLSIVRMLPRRANQPNRRTLGGAFVFQRKPNPLWELWLFESTEKKEETENTPSFEAAHNLLSLPYAGMNTQPSLSKRLIVMLKMNNYLTTNFPGMSWFLKWWVDDILYIGRNKHSTLVVLKGNGIIL